jgi:hypothetical protein
MLNMRMATPISNRLLSEYQIINTECADTVEAPAELLNAVLLVGDNQARSSFNRDRAPIDAAMRGTVAIGWRLPLQTALRSMSSVQQDMLYALAPELTVFFVKGAPAMQLENRNTSLHLSNGQTGVMDSLTFDGPTEAFVRAQLVKAVPGDVIMLPAGNMPLFINVSFTVSVRDFEQYWTDGQYLQARQSLADDGTLLHYVVTVPFPPVVNANDATEEIKSVKLGKGHGARRFYHCKPFVDVAYAISFWKCQGLTLDSVIVDFSLKARNLSLAVVYVVLTRIRNSKNMWLLACDMRYLHGMTRNKYVKHTLPPLRLCVQLRA